MQNASYLCRHMEPKCVHVACGLPSPVPRLVVHDGFVLRLRRLRRLRRSASWHGPVGASRPRCVRSCKASCVSCLTATSATSQMVSRLSRKTLKKRRWLKWKGSFIAPEGKEAEGAVEILGPWRNIYWILRSSLVHECLASYFTEFFLAKV